MPVCDLECGGGIAHEFIGPVRIIVVDEEQYIAKMFKLGLIAFIYVLMGIIITPSCLYYLDFTIQYANIFHVMLSTFTCQLLIPIGIMFHNPTSGAVAPLRPADRRKQHILLQTSSCVILIFVLLHSWAITPKNLENWFHSLMGHITVLLVVLNNVIGILEQYWDWDCYGLKQKPLFTIGHKICGMVVLVFCTMSYITGVTRWRFREQLPLRVRDTFPNVMGACAFINTALVLYYPIMKLTEEADLSRPTRL